MAKTQRKQTQRKGRSGRPRNIRVASSLPGGDTLAAARTELTGLGVSDELLQALVGPGGMTEIFREMFQGGLPPWLAPPLDVVMDEWTKLLDPSTDPVVAEVAGSQLVGMKRAFAPTEDELLADLAELISQVREHARPEALAMLRSLAVVGPAPLRQSAAAAADRLVVAGLTDPPWVSDLGAPTVGPSFGYTDFFGSQQLIALTFRYGRRSHAFAVLIDHDLGGGVKDCYVSVQVKRLRSGYRANAEDTGLAFLDHDAAQARAIMDAALSREPCPVALDQIECVRDNLDLLRQRVALLANDAPIPAHLAGTAVLA